MRHSVVVVALVACVVVQSRPARAQEVSGGVKGGVAVTRISGLVDALDAPVEEKARWGAVVGGFLDVAITPRVSFQPELLYVPKGSKVEGDIGPVEDGVQGEATFDVRYLELPLLLKFGAPSTPVYGLVGPALGFRLSAELREIDGGVTFEEDVTDRTTSLDVGIAFGIGARFGRFLVEGRWTEGLRDLDDGNFVEGKVRNRALALLAGVQF